MSVRQNCQIEALMYSVLLGIGPGYTATATECVHRNLSFSSDNISWWFQLYMYVRQIASQMYFTGDHPTACAEHFLRYLSISLFKAVRRTKTNIRIQWINTTGICARFRFRADCNILFWPCFYITDCIAIYQFIDWLTWHDSMITIIIPPHLHGRGNWNCSSCKTMTYLITWRRMEPRLQQPWYWPC